jgi:hypothetical protein
VLDYSRPAAVPDTRTPRIPCGQQGEWCGGSCVITRFHAQFVYARQTSDALAGITSEAVEPMGLELFISKTGLLSLGTHSFHKLQRVRSEQETRVWLLRTSRTA